MRRSILALCVSAFSITALTTASGQQTAPPKLPHEREGAPEPGPRDGYVPDRETAVKIAEVILSRLYGEKTILASRPYKVVEDDNIWWICGTVPEGSMGTAFRIAISRQTAAVLYVDFP